MPYCDPGIAVTDDALVQSIGELRRAFGQDGSRLIRTVPRRGYRFEAVVSPDRLTVAEVSDSGAAQRGSDPVGDAAAHPSGIAERSAGGKPWRMLAAGALIIVLASAALWIASELGFHGVADPGISPPGVARRP